MDLGLKGRVALVMGSSAGIGLGIAEALAREGARVAVVSRSQGRAEEAAANVAGEAAPFVADTDDLDRLEQLVAEVEAALGPIEILVPNTGGPPLGAALMHELDDWERAYRSLVLAPRVLAGAVVPGMREREWGRIVNVGSTSTREPIPGLNLSNSHRMAAVGFSPGRSPPTGSRSTPSPPAASPPSGSPPTSARWRPPRRPRNAKCPPGGSAGRRSTATSSPSSAPSAPPSSPAL